MAIALSALAVGTPRPALAADDACLPPDANGVVQCIFQYTGAAQYWVVPTGITSATWALDGAQGESESSFLHGGYGAHVAVTLPVSPADWGKTVRLIVGGVGANGVGGFGGGGNGGTGANGQNLGSGGGGGASWVSVESPTDGYLHYLVAGGGGGVGDSSLDAFGGVGGNASTAGQRGQNVGNSGGGGAGGGGNTAT